MLSDYLTINQRRDHCSLQSPCQTKTIDMARTRKILLKYLGLTKADVKGMHCCHLCPSDSTHGGCSNPQHLYFGTRTENKLDRLFGHFNHPNTKSEAWLDPHCPTCGYQSADNQSRSRRQGVKKHIKRGSCIFNTNRKQRIHPDFQHLHNNKTQEIK
jgi:hypothetical protein